MSDQELPSKPPRAASVHGRSLDDFDTLSGAEEKLLDCYRRGHTADISDDRPHQESDDNRIRAAFVRFLALGGDERVQGHEHGVELRGAWVSGLLDLESAELKHRLMLRNCVIEEIVAVQAELKFLGLDGSELLGGFWGDSCRCEAGILLREGFHAKGGVRLTNATIGSLDCRGGRFENPGGTALSCASARVRGSVYLTYGFAANGEVNFSRAKIGGDFDCYQGKFENQGEDALYLERVDIAGSLMLGGGFAASGRVSLGEAAIGGNLHCSGGSFAGDARDALYCGRARIGGSAYFDFDFSCAGRLSLSGASIGGDLSLRQSRLCNPGGQALDCPRTRVMGAFFFQSIAAIEGEIWLTSMQVDSLWDDSDSWQLAKNRYWLDGFTYGRLGGGTPMKARGRIAWLDGQLSPAEVDDFRPQPWEQAIAALRTMGHPNEAKTIAIAKHRRERAAGRFTGNSRVVDWIYGALLGYGYRASRLVGGLALVWLLCAGAYWLAANPAMVGSGTYLIAPAARPPLPTCLAARSAAHSSEECPEQPPSYEDFEALIYSADVLLPVLDLGYKDEWQPVVRGAAGEPLLLGRALRWLYWAEIALGWLAGLQLVGLLGNLIKKD